MRASGVNAAIMRVIEKLEQKMCAIEIARIGVARITGFYCILLLIFAYASKYSKHFLIFKQN